MAADETEQQTVRGVSQVPEKPPKNDGALAEDENGGEVVGGSGSGEGKKDRSKVAAAFKAAVRNIDITTRPKLAKKTPASAAKPGGPGTGTDDKKDDTARTVDAGKGETPALRPALASSSRALSASTIDSSLPALAGPVPSIALPASPAPAAAPPAHGAPPAAPLAPAKTNESKTGKGIPPSPTENPPKAPNHLDLLKNAILYGRNSELQTLLAGDPSLVNQKIGSSLGTVVHYVIRNGNGNRGTERERREMLRIVASFPGVDWDATDNIGRTPLHLACSHTRNYSEIAKFLLEHGADPNILDETQCSPLHDTVSEGQKEMVIVLLSDRRTNLSTPGNNKRTALHKAAYRGHLEIANLLLNHDPEIVDLRDGDGLTPLHDASRQNKPEVVERLIEEEADVDARANKGMTPLHFAASCNALAAAKMLLRADALEVFNHAKETPLMIAERKGNIAMVELLQTPMDVDTSLAKSGKGLQTSQPTGPQKDVSERFSGLIWPSIDGNSKRDKATMFDMLYGTFSLRGSSDEYTTLKTSYRCFALAYQRDARQTARP